MLIFILTIILSYLLGSLPTSILVGKLLKGIDIRDHGSKNAGATNIYRVLGLKPYLFVLFVDFLKGFVATAYVSNLAVGSVPMSEIQLSILTGLAAVGGHIWTVFARFRGGKGVATAGGMFIGLMPILVLIGLGVYLAVVATFRYVSLGSILASISIPVSLMVKIWVFNQNIPIEIVITAFLLPILILFTHRSNIARLIKGKENRVDFFEKLGKKKSNNHPESVGTA